MRLFLFFATGAIIAPLAAFASIVIENHNTPRTIKKGENCSVDQFGGDGPPVSQWGVNRISPNVVKQYISSGEYCEQRETIAVYYDCAAQRAVWLGGDRSLMEQAFPDYWDQFARNPERYGSREDSSSPSGPAEYFVDHHLATFAPDYALDALLSEARSQTWIPQTGEVGSSRMSVDGRTFDLSCGCRLPVGP